MLFLPSKALNILKVIMCTVYVVSSWEGALTKIPTLSDVPQENFKKIIIYNTELEIKTDIIWKPQ